MISFTEWLFSHVPNEVTEGTVQPEDPVAWLSNLHAGARTWPVEVGTLAELREYLFAEQFRRLEPKGLAMLAATAYKEDNTTKFFTYYSNLVAEVSHSVASIAHVTKLAWADYQNFIKTQTD